MPEHEWLDVGALAASPRNSQVRGGSLQGSTRKLNQRLQELAKCVDVSPADGQPRPQVSAVKDRQTSQAVVSIGSVRPRTGDGTDGLSSYVSRYNRTMKGKVAQALDHAGDAKMLQQGGETLSSLRTNQHRLDIMADEIYSVCDGVREQHIQFLASQEELWKNIAPKFERKAEADDAANKQGAPKGGAKSHTLVGGGGPGVVQRAKTNGKGMEFFSAIKEATAYHNVRDPTPMVDKTFKIPSRAQERVMDRFDDIDEGKADRQTAFDAITSDARRVETKLDYFRERCQLVLPQIEEHFMQLDTRTGCMSVDITKVRTRKMRAQHADDVKSQDHNSTASLAVDLESTSATYSNKPNTAGTGEISLVPSKCTLMSCSSWESLEQRAARLAVQGHVRDFRIAAARESERKQLAYRRQMQLQANQSKSLRKALATRDRSLFTWVVVAMATQAIVRLWKTFVLIYTEPGPEANPQRYTAGYWQSIIDASDASKLPGRLIPAVRRLLVVALMRRCDGEQRAQRSLTAFRTWCKILRPMRFLAVLYRRRRLNHFAEILKGILNTSWRGFQLRASCKVYIQQMNFLQFSMRCSCRARSCCKNYIFMPTLWEVETTILGEVIGMPAATLAAEIEQHRNAWDLKQRMIEVRQLCEIRTQWRDWLDEKVSFSQRISTFYEESKTRTSRWVLERDGRRQSGSLPSRSGSRYSVRKHRDSRQVVPMIRFIKRREKLSNVHFSVFGKASMLTGGVYGSRMQRTSHPLMNLIDKYRLAPEIRNAIVNRMLRENTERWYFRYQDYRDQCNTFKNLWLNWRSEIAALGPHNRNVWPSPPPIPRFPYELTKVDEKELHVRVLEALKSTQAGQLL